MPILLQRPQAKEDLLDIWCYIAQDSPKAADAWIDQLVDAARRLAANPGMGRLRPELLPGIRSFPVGNYILFYLEINKGIDLVRVLSAYRNLDALFQEDVGLFNVDVCYDDCHEIQTTAINEKPVVNIAGTAQA